MIEAKHLPLVKQQVEFATDYYLGGYENSIADGYMPHHMMPSCEDLINEIYHGLQHCTYFPGAEAPGPAFEIQECDETLLKGMIAYQIINSR